MTAPRPIETNFSDSQGQQITNATRTPINPIDLTRYTATLGGPFAVEMAAQRSGGYNTKAASIVSAAVNASAGGGMGVYSAPMSYGNYGAATEPYRPFTSAAMPQTHQAMSVGRQSRQTAVTPPLIPGGGSAIDIASAQVQAADMDFAAFFSLQQVASQQTLKWTGLSNVVNQRDSALANILRNVKV